MDSKQFYSNKTFKFLGLEEHGEHCFIAFLSPANQVYKFYTKHNGLKSKIKDLEPFSEVYLTVNIVPSAKEMDYRVFLQDVNIV